MKLTDLDPEKLREQLVRRGEESYREIQAAKFEEDVERLRVKFLGRKGEITQILRSLGGMDPEARRRVGQEANSLKQGIEAALSKALATIKEEALRIAAPALDVTLPGRRPPWGRLHPLTQINREVCDIFLHLGFETVEGPEVELDYYNFEALNIPPDHPARDMQDTFYFNDKVLLRTHTSPACGGGWRAARAGWGSFHCA